MGKMSMNFGMVAGCFLLAACTNDPGGEWKLSGTDLEREIDHYYLESSLKQQEDGFKVRTKLIPHKGDKKVEEATNIKNAYAVEVDAEVFCKDSVFLVYSKEYFDKQGISLLIEKDGGGMDASRQIVKGQALYPMMEDLCSRPKKPTAGEAKPADGKK